MLFSRLTFACLISSGTLLAYFGFPAGGLPFPLATAQEPAAKAADGFHVVALNGHNFTLPVGFTIELAAGPPLVDRPVSAAFDEKGRLYVTDSSGSNDKTAEQVKTKPHRVRRLEDTDGDGTFDKSTLFVKNVMFPEGAMWYRGSLYVTAPPHILKFTDTNDDGLADKEEIWFDGKTVGGCANDLHGPFLGPDGWFYWTKGGFEKQEYTLPNGKKWTSRAAHVFRAKPDGSNLEPVMTGGMDNPVGLAFTPTGDVLVCGTFFQHPADGKRDGILHAVYGGVFGKDHSPIYDHPWTSPQPLPVMTHLGPAAPASLTRYQSDQFGKEYEDNLFCSQFNLRKISRHVLRPDSATYRTIDSDFLASDNRDFHPTDVVEDADGSLLVLDTGGWFKLCCPTSQLVKEDITGAIYRVRKAGAHKVDDPRGAKFDWNGNSNEARWREDLGRLLGDPRPAVRWRAVERLAELGRDWPTIVGSATFGTKSHQVELNAIWAALRTNDAAFEDQTFRGLASGDESVRLATLHGLSLCRVPRSRIRLGLFRDGSPASVRLTSEAIGRSVPQLRPAGAGRLALIGGPAQAFTGHFDGGLAHGITLALKAPQMDRVLEHALTYALIEAARPEDLRYLFIKDQDPRVRKAGLIALDQMGSRLLEPQFVLAELDSPDAALKETAWWIVGRHPEWGERLAGRFAEQLNTADRLTPASRDELAARLVKFTNNDAVQNALAEAVKAGPKVAKQVALRVMAQSALKAMPATWRTGLLDAAPRIDDADVLRAALAVLRTSPVAEKDFDQFLAALPRKALWPNGVPPDDFKLASLSARPAGAALDDATAAFLLAHTGREEPVAVRSEAADTLVRAKLTPPQRVRLAGSLKAVGALEFTKLLAAFAKATDAETGRAFVAALSDPGLRRSVRLEQVKPILDKYPAAVKAEAEKLYTLLAEDRKEERAKLDRLMATLAAGDIRRGQAVFNGAKASCSACHKIGYVGGTVGPDLRRIGAIRSERDLVEAIVFPSASFVRSYEPFRVVTADGKAYNGVLKKDAPDEVVLSVAADQEVRIPRVNIEEMTPSTVSVMPAGLDQQLTPQELADLVAFLKANTR